MKKGIVIVNTARGGVMDEDALVKALENGRVWSAGLDVYQQEPNIHPGLVSNPHVCLLPHMGTTTVEVCYPELIFKIPRDHVLIECRQNRKWKNGT